MRLDREVTHVLVADSSIADVQVVSPRTLYVYGRRVGQTTLSATDSGSGTAAQVTLRVGRDAAAAQAALPPGAQALRLSFAGDRIVLRGSVAGLGSAVEADATARAYNPSPLPPLDRTQLAGAQQVTLRVRFAEVSRDDLTALGINWNLLAQPGTFAISLLTGNFLGSSQGGALTNVPGLNTQSSFGNASLAVSQRRLSVDALLNALQSEGLLTLLAEPNLTTVSGEQASFLAGGEVPIPVPQALGTTTIEYKQFGVQLQFTPTLLPGDRIALRVRPEVSEISTANSVTYAGASVPAFITRRVETNVEMASGQTLAIAGLFQRSQQDNLSRFPFLGDVPVLGSLFRSKRFQLSQTELVVLITPYLSQPVERPGAYLLPGQAQAGATSMGPVQSGFTVD